MTHICVSKLIIIGSHHCSDNGWSPGWRQAIIWTNAGLLSIWALGTNPIEILIKCIYLHSRKKQKHLKMSPGNRRPFVSASICVKWFRYDTVTFFFLSKISTINTAQLDCKSEWWDVFCEFEVWPWLSNFVIVVIEYHVIWDHVIMGPKYKNNIFITNCRWEVNFM